MVIGSLCGKLHAFRRTLDERGYDRSMSLVHITRERPAAIIFDVDGTLCDVRALRHHVESDKRGMTRADFRSFHGDSIDAPEHEEVTRLYRRAVDAGFLIVVVTGREEQWAFLTSLWLAEHGLSYAELAMRPRGDFRRDAVVKEEMLEKLIRRYDLRLAVDDRSDIIDVWRRYSIPTIRVGPDGVLGDISWAATSRGDQDIGRLVTEPPDTPTPAR